MTAPSQLADAEVSAAVEAVLADRPFTTATDLSDVFVLLEGYWERLTSDLYLTDPSVFWLTIVLLLLALGLLGWHLATSMRAAWRAVRAESVVSEEELVPRSFFDLTPARRAHGRGQPRDAIELAWLALRLRLGRGEPGLTPRQWSRAVSPTLPADAAAPLQELVRLHEQACYAGHAPSLEDAAYVIAIAQRLGAAT